MSRSAWPGAGLLALALAAAGLACGCGSGEPEPGFDVPINPAFLFERVDDPSGVAWGERLQRRLAVSPATLHPLLARSSAEQDVIGLINDSLWNVGADLSCVPSDNLIDSVDVSDDHHTVIVKLEAGNTWHDSHPFTARDVAFSFRMIRDERVPTTQRAEGVSRVEALDDLTVRFTLDQPTPALFWQLTFKLVPEHILAPVLDSTPPGEALDMAGFGRHPVGLGPYRLVEWREDESIRLRRWEGYRGKWPFFEEVLYRIIPDDSVALQLFSAGKLDEMELSPDQWRAVESDRRFADRGVRYFADEATFSYICWNVTDPVLEDVKVRRALAMALDVEGFSESFYHGLCRRCVGPWSSETWMFDPGVTPLPYDPEAAGKLLDEAGFVEDTREGIRRRESDGRALRFTVLAPQESKMFTELAQVYQESLRRIGVEMKVELIEFASLLERAARHDFQAVGLGMGTAADPMYAVNRFGTRGERNYGLYSNPDLDALFAAGRTTFDAEARAGIYRKAHVLIYRDQPYAFLLFRSSLWAFARRMRGLASSPTGPIDHYPGNLAWWVPAGEQRFGKQMSLEELARRAERAIDYWGAGD